METNNIPENLLKKIKSLMALEASAKDIGSIEEAANAAARLRDILMKYNLDQAILNQGRPQALDDVVEVPFLWEAFTGRNEGQWIRTFGGVIAKNNLCKCLSFTGPGNKLILVGTRANIEVVLMTIENLSQRIRQMARKAYSDYDGHEKRNTFIRGYLVGVVEGIDYQLTSRINEEERADNANTTTALTITSLIKQENSRIAEYLSSKYRMSNKRSSGPSYSGSGGREKGYQDGKNMDLRTGQTNKNRLLN